MAIGRTGHLVFLLSQVCHTPSCLNNIVDETTTARSGVPSKAESNDGITIRHDVFCLLHALYYTVLPVRIISVQVGCPDQCR